VTTTAKKGTKKAEGASLIMQAQAALAVGLWDTGTKASSEALHIFQTTNNKVGEAAALMCVSSACSLAGEYREAISSAEDAALLAKTSGANKQMAYGYAAVASAALALLKTMDNVDTDISVKALEAAQNAQAAFRDLDLKEELSKVLSDLAMAYLLSGNNNMAIATAKKAQRMFQADRHVGGEARALLIVSRALQKEGSSDVAMQQLVDAADIFTSIDDQEGLQETYHLMENFQTTAAQEQQDFTKRVMARFDKGTAATDATMTFSAPGVATHFYMPPKKEVALGPGTTVITGFMPRAATVVAPKSSTPASSGQDNRFLLYNVSWN